jgi:SNF family Na+-dependent transporter
VLFVGGVLYLKDLAIGRRRGERMLEKFRKYNDLAFMIVVFFSCLIPMFFLYVLGFVCANLWHAFSNGFKEMNDVWQGEE